VGYEEKDGRVYKWISRRIIKGWGRRKGRE
jgi:hypothetical protein